MTLRIFKALTPLVGWAHRITGKWKNEVYWGVVRHTPVGPNPHAAGTLEWYLHENGNRIAATHRIYRKTLASESPWVKLARGSQPPKQP